MPRQRPLLLLLLITLIAGIWSVAMGVLGLWLMLEPHEGLLGNRAFSLSAGLVALCAAQLVFIECVSDRLFPRPHPHVYRIAWSSNLVTLGAALCVLFVVSLGLGI